MAKHVRLRLTDVERLELLGKAFSSPVRIKILQLLNAEKLSIADIARKLDIPTSSTALDVKVLQNAGLVKTEELPGSRGNAKLCDRATDNISIRLTEIATEVDHIVSVEMPVGAYTKCKVGPDCGIANEFTILGMDDMEQSFYMPEHMSAQILWTSRGYVEYTFPNQLRTMPYKCIPQLLILTAELCSEASGYRENWKSDITLWVNGVDCGTWISPGDFGKRRGKITPISWSAGRTQYGHLTTWEICHDGCYINHTKVCSVTLSDLNIMEQNAVFIRIGNKEDAVHAGGMHSSRRNPHDCQRVMLILRRKRFFLQNQLISCILKIAHLTIFRSYVFL